MVGDKRFAAVCGPIPGLEGLLRAHPRIDEVRAGSSKTLEFSLDGWRRSIQIGNQAAEVAGLLETLDNNPLVCADVVSVPSPGATLALIALAPLARSGLLQESPLVQATIPIDEDEFEAFLDDEGWKGGFSLDCDPMDLRGAAACTVMAVVPTPDRIEDLDAIFDEFYGRSLYVRNDADSPWDVELVLGKPYALYRLRITEDAPNSLLTVQAMADLNGKCGAAQMVHAMNVMCGLEESLGISE
ncbi:MAG: hypothetical protein HZC36_04580 [Armatimonadetes bacterium]|nr:hypothetical protein [Armatimonadota bacterium]